MNADEESAPDGTRWVVNIHYESGTMVPVPDKPGWSRIDPLAQPSSYGVVDRKNWDIKHGEYSTEAEAREAADELNRFDVQGPLDPAFMDRRERLKQLAPHFKHWAYTSREGPPGARWPVRPERFLVLTYGRGWHPEDWEYLVDDQEGLAGILADPEHEVLRIIDLDAGLDVPFSQSVAFTLDMPPRPSPDTGETRGETG